MRLFAWLKDYVFSILDWLTTGFNVIFLFSLNANQSTSGRCFLSQKNILFRILWKIIDTVFFLLFRERNHCENAVLRDIERGVVLKATYDTLLKEIGRDGSGSDQKENS